MEKRVIINLKPSHRVVSNFKAKFPMTTFYGSTTLGSKGKSYLIPLDVYEQNKEEIKKYGSKARYQPFM